ncbi:BA75_01450T0 [Komagataella pastoris]|uniref:BA75_01450T0 n=1 Tax=Komagataella pastoris TaxID=4922 RepID=A0A1B2J868_PICPA|nr:BA75_01450T0 [Komagataella pastoris]
MLRFQILPIPGSRRVPMTVELVRQAPPLHSFLSSSHILMEDLVSFNTTGGHKSFITIHLDSSEIQLDSMQNFYIRLYLGNITLSKSFQYGLLTHVYEKLWCIIFIEELDLQHNDHQFAKNHCSIKLSLEDETLLSFDVVPENERLVDLLHMEPEAIPSNDESHMSELLTSRYFKSLYLDTSSLQIFIKSSLIKYRNISTVDKPAKLVQLSSLIIEPSTFDQRHLDENITSPEKHIIHRDEPSYRTLAFKENSHSLDDLTALKLREIQHQVLLLLELLNLQEFDHIPAQKPAHVAFKSRIRSKRQLVPTLIGTVIEKNSSSAQSSNLVNIYTSSDSSNETLISKYLAYIDKLLVYDAINSQKVTYTFYKLIYPYYIKQLPTLLKHLYTKIKGISPEKISLKRKKPSRPTQVQKSQSQPSGDQPIPVSLKRTGSALSDMQKKMFDMSTHHKEKEKSSAPPALPQQVDSFIFSKPKKSLSLASQIEIQETPKKPRIQVKETPIKQLKTSPEEEYITSISPTKPYRKLQTVTPTPSPKKTRPGEQIGIESSPFFQTTIAGEYEEDRLVSSPVFSDANE